MGKGPKVSHHEYFNFDSDEDDLLGEDDLLFDKASDNIENEVENNHASQEKSNDDDKKEIGRLTKELNNLKLAHETTLQDHRELARTHDKLHFEKNNFSEPSVEMDSGTSPERSPSDPGTPRSHSLPKAATRSRRKINSDEEDVDFIHDKYIPQKEKTTIKKIVRKEYARPADIKALEARLANNPGHKRVRKIIIHIVGRLTSMYEDPTEAVDEEEEVIPAEVPHPKKKNLMDDAMPKKTTPKPSAPKAKKSVAPKRTTKDIPADHKNKGSTSREFVVE
ncbi:hypothetical protein ZWY2020_058704 [Hordeum vulgare]|nr:hypothetical protein ZWY2020_058704 [Hordeum vulgare]